MCVYGGVSALKGPVRVTDVILRIGADAAMVWTLANLPAGQLEASPMLSACLALLLGCSARPMLILCTVPTQALKRNVMVQKCNSMRQDTMSRPAEHRDFALYIEHRARQRLTC